MKRTALPLLSIFLFAFFTSCNGTGARVIFKNAPNVDDHKLFVNEILEASSQPFEFKKRNKNIDIPGIDKWLLHKKEFKAENYEAFLEESKSTAFVIIKNDSILYESYHNGFKQDSFHQVFSVTKAFTTTLTGIAIEEGKIKSIDQLVSDFIPEFAENGRRDIKIKHLMQMTAGLRFKDKEQIIRLGRMYYNKAMIHYMHKIKMKYDAGTNFDYSSMSTLILGICIERATGQSYSAYLQEKLWKPLGMEYNGLMNISKRDSVAHAFGGLSTMALDLAKLGRLYLNEGDWNGEQIITKEWAQAAGERDTTEGSWYGYNRGFWLHTDAQHNHYYKQEHGSAVPSPEALERTDFLAGGYKGQIVYINPQYNMIVIRMGTSESHIAWNKSLPKLCEMLNN